MTGALWMTVVLGLAHAGPCPTASTPDQLQAALDDAQAALVAQDPTFSEHVARAHALVPCLDRPPSVATAGWFHRIDGLQRFSAGDDPSAPFASARRIDRTAPLLPGVSLDGSDLGAAYAAAARQAATPVPLTLPRRHSAYVDGQPAATRFVGQPSLVQVLDPHDEVVLSVHALPDAPLPPVPVPRRIHPVWASLSGGLLLASGVFYGTARSAHATYTAMPVEWDNYAARRAQAARLDAFLVGSATSLGLAVGAGGLAFIQADP